MQERHSTKELRSHFNKSVRKLAKERKTSHSAIYSEIYDKFSKFHNLPFDTKINIDYISKNKKYLLECLEIAITKLDNERLNKGA